MVESKALGSRVGVGGVSAFDAASYLFQMSRELAEMADEHGFIKVAAAFELARSLSAESMVGLAVENHPDVKAAPDDAA